MRDASDAAGVEAEAGKRLAEACADALDTDDSERTNGDGSDGDSSDVHTTATQQLAWWLQRCRSQCEGAMGESADDSSKSR